MRQSGQNSQKICIFLSVKKNGSDARNALNFFFRYNFFFGLVNFFEKYDFPLFFIIGVIALIFGPSW